jgi:hypothetical protein
MRILAVDYPKTAEDEAKCEYLKNKYHDFQTNRLIKDELTAV